MKMKSVILFFLFFLLLEALCSEGCLKEEREALLGLNSAFHLHSYSYSHSEDCCLPNLELLHISFNKLNIAASIVSCLDGLPSLKSLYLGDNGLNASSFRVLETLSSKLPNLEVLDISDNYLTNHILPSLEGFTSLKELYLLDTGLDSDLHMEALCSKLRNLEVLDLSYNNFNHSDIGSALSGLSSLKFLYLGDSELTWRSILKNDGFKWPTNLQELWLYSNNLSNNFLSSLSGLPHLQSLDLSYNQLEGAINISGLSTLSNLTNLYLSYNKIHYFVADKGSKSLSRLNVLHLDGNMIDAKKLRESLRALSSSIRNLSMSYNDFKGTILADDWSKLKKLEELNLIQNGFEGLLPKSFINMTSLRMLDLSQNHFMGKFESNIATLTSLEYFYFTENHNIATLTSLEYFYFTENQFEVPISFTPFANHSNLKVIYGKGNKVKLDSQNSSQTWIPKFQLHELSLSSTIETSSFQLPKFLFYQKHLRSLDFSSLKLEGGFPHWLLENNTKLNEVLFRNCSLTGTMKLPLRPLRELWSIDVSANTITGEISSKNINSIYPNLEELNMSRNFIQGSIPRELGQMELLYELDLSYNQLSGEISEDIFGVGHIINFLKLSNNKLEGPIFTIPTNLESLSLNDNNFSGSLPSNIFNTSIISLDVSNNHLVGKIPSLLKNISGLSELRMSNNHFEGFIPLELTQLEDLEHLDLSQNNLTGLVPSFLNSSMKFIHLSNNHLTGLTRKMFTGNSPLVMLDLSYNEILGGIQDMIEDLSYSKLNFLLLKGNHITGDIPKQLCQLINLTMLDLSDNKFLGEIPHCLGTMPFDNNNLHRLLKASKGSFDSFKRDSRSPSQLEIKKEKASFTSKKRIDTYTGNILAYMSGIDLSNNKLKGNIPYELGNLTRIQTLNLSHNDLIGQIPDSFLKLVQTESLDLSFNKLSGEIPSKLNILTSLEVFSVAYNNLSGPIPEWINQFATFEESSYEGNPFLCGTPLRKSCHPAPTIIPNDLDFNKDNDRLVDMYVFYVSFVVSYTLALLTTVAALYINPSWRQTWWSSPPSLEVVSLELEGKPIRGHPDSDRSHQ
ncbi:hypothetical protein VNO80_07083 [Phaseolus coccineus]|uniref:Uncharacterized protein n=1 Tax=Phaseolus coccineus TaxID=3886 RepID=A0AAN9RJK1_PHACN